MSYSYMKRDGWLKLVSLANTSRPLNRACHHKTANHSPTASHYQTSNHSQSSKRNKATSPQCSNPNSNRSNHQPHRHSCSLEDSQQHNHQLRSPNYPCGRAKALVCITPSSKSVCCRPQAEASPAWYWGPRGKQRPKGTHSKQV
jgi:hypothetical protein